MTKLLVPRFSGFGTYKFTCVCVCVCLSVCVCVCLSVGHTYISKTALTIFLKLCTMIRNHIWTKVMVSDFPEKIWELRSGSIYAEKWTLLGFSQKRL